MTKVHAQESTQTHPGLGSESCYVNLQFLRIDTSFHKLMPNEKVVAKQEFLSAFDTFSRQMPLTTYALTGLRPDCDILIWRMSPSLEALQGMTYRLFSSGLGKHLATAYSFLGIPLRSAATPSNSKYLFVLPHAGGKPTALDEVHRTVLKHSSVRLHVVECAGLGDLDYVFSFETDDPKDYLKLAAELKSLREPGDRAFPCVLREIRDIVDCFG